MGNLIWYPINPLITEDGSFAAFSNEENSAEFKPVELDGDSEPLALFNVSQTSMNLQTAVKLGVPVGSISGSYDSFALFYEAMLYSEKIVQVPVGGKIYGTRWGAGLRLSIKVSQIKTNISASFGAVAASTQMGLAQSEYQITGIGISKPDVLSLLPGPGELNVDNYSKILNAVTVIKDYMADSKNELTAKPFQVFISDDINADIFDDSRSIMFAYKHISRRNSLKIAIEDALSKQNELNKFNNNVIKSVYSKYNLLEENQEPTKKDKDIATKFLNF